MLVTQGEKKNPDTGNKDNITLTLLFDWLPTFPDIYLTDNTGKEVYHGNKRDTTINIPNISIGTYTLRVTDTHWAETYEVLNKKLVITENSGTTPTREYKILDSYADITVGFTSNLTIEDITGKDLTLEVCTGTSNKGTAYKVTDKVLNGTITCPKVLKGKNTLRFSGTGFKSVTKEITVTDNNASPITEIAVEKE